MTIKRYSMQAVESGSSGDYYPRICDDVKGDLVTYADYEHELAEKDRLHNKLQEKHDNLKAYLAEKDAQFIRMQDEYAEKWAVQDKRITGLIEKNNKQAHELERLKQIVAACNKDNLSDAVMNAIIERNDLLRMAVEFALHVDRDAHCGPKADAFLATPAATDLQVKEEHGQGS